MTTVINGSSPSITFSDSTTQTTAALPLTGGTVTGNISVTSASATTISVTGGATNSGYAWSDGTRTGVLYASGLGGSALFSTSNHPLYFGTNNTTVAQLDTSGNFMVGTTTTAGKITSTPTAAQQGYASISPASFTASSYYANSSTAASTNFFHHLCYSNSVVQFLVYGNGVTQNAPNSYGGISDIKLKENIVLAGSQWEDIKALGKLVKKYNFKNDAEKKQQIGWVAQDVQQISPGLVVENHDLDSDGKPTGETTLGIAYSIAYMKAVKALGEALIRIESLEERLTALEAK
jgi:hypothetical protein